MKAKNIDINEIITRIGHYRNEAQLSARGLSLTIDKNGAYINHLENKKVNLKVSVLLDILDVFEISCAEFFSDNYETYKEDKEILDLLKALPLERKKLILELIKNIK